MGRQSIAKLFGDRPNPYDFRTPISDQDLLVGREDELEQAQEHLASTAAGKPVHLALIGERAAGKTSLLNAIGDLARTHELIVVRVSLDEATTSTPFTFFKAVFEATVEALVEAGALAADDPRYDTWLRQIHFGEPGSPSEELLRFGMVAAGVLRGADHQDVSPSLLVSDAERLGALALQGGHPAIALLLDEADLIGENAPLIQKLRNLFQAGVSWMVVAAGTAYLFSTLRDVFSPIPRQFVRIPVGPFENPFYVSLCVAQPLLKAGLEQETVQDLQPDLSSLRDIFEITHGRPYEIALVCYHIWDSMKQGIQEDFRLSPEVLDEVLTELTEIGREKTVSAVEAIRSLSGAEFECALRVLPFEQFTVRELALSRLAPADYSDEELRREITRVESEITDLKLCGLLDAESDRFTMRGDIFDRVYLKYAAKRHAADHRGHDVRFDDTYTAFITRTFLAQVRDAALNSAKMAWFPTRFRRYDFGATDVGSQLASFEQAIDDRDGERLARSRIGLGFRFQPSRSEGRHDALDAGVVFLGLVFTAGPSHIEVAELHENTISADAHDVRVKIADWRERNRDLLTKYDASLTRINVGVMDVDLTKDAFAHARQVDIGATVMRLFERGLLDRALKELATTIDYVERSAEERPLDARSRSRLADCHNRYGFISAVLGTLDDAERHLKRAIELDENERWLRLHNLSYVAAARGDFTLAHQLLVDSERAREGERVDDGTLVLVHLPTVPQWTEPGSKWNVVSLSREWVGALIGLQKLVYRLLLGQASLAEFRAAVADLPVLADSSIHRLAGWVLLAVVGDAEAALDQFRRAAPQRDPRSVESKEVEFAEGVTRVTSSSDED